MSPTDLYQASAAALQSETGVIYHSVALNGGGSDTTSVRAGQNEGMATLVLKDGKRRGLLSIVLTTSAAYVRGNVDGLESVQFSPAAAAREAGRWVEVPSSATGNVSSVYQNLSATLTIHSIYTGIALAAPITRVTGKVVDGEKTLAVKGYCSADPGPPPAMETLYVRDSSNPLPVRASIAGSGLSVTVDFTSWGRPPVVHAPHGAIPFRKSWLVGTK